jgi:hypothetical protein
MGMNYLFDIETAEFPNATLKVEDENRPDQSDNLL